MSLSFSFFMLCFWVSLLFLKTSVGGRALLFLFCSLFSLLSVVCSVSSFNFFLVSYIFLGDILVVVLITCMSSPREMTSASKVGLSFFFLGFSFLVWKMVFSLSVVILFSGSWLSLILFFLLFSLFVFSKMLPKSQLRLT